MSKINLIQNAIKELDGGSFQKLFDSYLYKKYGFENIQTLGVQTGTNKTTKGTPDSFVVTEEEKYILIMYGTVETNAYSKLEKDILSCFNDSKLKIERGKIDKIICAYSSTNIHIEQMEKLKTLIDGIKIELIGLSTISHDLLVNYPFLANDFLSIQIDTGQLYPIDEFVEAYDKNGMNAPLNMEFYYREKELKELYDSIKNTEITMVTGSSGLGKTRLVVEVCRHFRDEGWNVICVKNNGELLYSDIKYYLSEKGKYLLFIDDANQTTSLEYVLDYIKQISKTTIIKVVMTVRDYAKQRVANIVCKYVFPSEVQITILSEDKIQEILKCNLEILNPEYLDRIGKVAKGNVRLAILAAKIAKEKGFLSIRNATDIFSGYYGDVILNSELSENEIKSLFVISLLGPLRFKEHIVALKILEYLGINKEEFVSFCHLLNEKEIIDLYLDEAVKVSDQSLGNYMLEYVLVEKKLISITTLLGLGFPKFKNKLVYAFNTLISLFDSEKLREYISEQVNLSWNKAPEELQWEYLKVFHALNQEKALFVLKSRMDKMRTVEVDLVQYDFEQRKNNHHISSEEVEILSSFKYSEYYNDVLDLMGDFFKKRPDLVMDFYFAFADRLGVDKYSHQYEYTKEYKMVECLWNKCEGGKEKNLTILLLHIIQQFLQCQFHTMEAVDNDRSFNFLSFNLVLNDGSKKLRHYIWKILSELYDISLYRQIIESILKANYTSGLEKEQAKEIFEFDLQCIKEQFYNNWEILTFSQCEILAELEKRAKWMGSKKKIWLKKYRENPDFLIYHTLLKEHVKGRTWQEDEEQRKIGIKNMILDFEDSDFRRMFRICKEHENTIEREAWSLQAGLDIVFSCLETSPSKYLRVLKIYLQTGAPFGISPTCRIIYLLKNIGFQKIKEEILNIDYEYRSIWLNALWEYISEQDITKDEANLYLDFLSSEVKKDKPSLPYIKNLSKYLIVDPSFVKAVSELVLEGCADNTYIVASYLGNYHDPKVVEAIVKVYENDIDILEALYLASIGDYFDYDGKLLLALIDKKPTIWDVFTKKLSKHIRRTGYENNVFENIWRRGDYKQLIEIAYNNLIGDDYRLGREEAATTIFANNTETSEMIILRKKEWMSTYIQNNYKDNRKVQSLFGIIATLFSEWRIEYLLLLMEMRSDIELFKSLYFFPLVASWSGSEIPLIERKIDFLEEVIVLLKGMTYIEHRAYIREKIDSLKNINKT